MSSCMNYACMKLINGHRPWDGWLLTMLVWIKWHILAHRGSEKATHHFYFLSCPLHNGETFSRPRGERYALGFFFATPKLSVSSIGGSVDIYGKFRKRRGRKRRQISLCYNRKLAAINISAQLKSGLHLLLSVHSWPGYRENRKGP